MKIIPSGNIDIHEFSSYFLQKTLFILHMGTAPSNQNFIKTYKFITVRQFMNVPMYDQFSYIIPTRVNFEFDGCAVEGLSLLSKNGETHEDNTLPLRTWLFCYPFTAPPIQNKLKFGLIKKDYDAIFN